MPVINKVDLPTAQPQVIKQQLKDTFDYPIDDITLVSMLPVDFALIYQ